MSLKTKPLDRPLSILKNKYRIVNLLNNVQACSILIILILSLYLKHPLLFSLAESPV